MIRMDQDKLLWILRYDSVVLPHGGTWKMQEREADDSPLRSTEDKNVWNCTSTIEMLSQRSV
jgi:hypothetical protein